MSGSQTAPDGGTVMDERSVVESWTSGTSILKPDVRRNRA
jgi:hypothetical protein